MTMDRIEYGIVRQNSRFQAGNTRCVHKAVQSWCRCHVSAGRSERHATKCYFDDCQPQPQVYCHLGEYLRAEDDL